jgi:hypothetical protein
LFCFILWQRDYFFVGNFFHQHSYMFLSNPILDIAFFL